MGLISLALASAPPFLLLNHQEACERIAKALHVALERLPHDQGVVPHFIDSVTEEVCGNDYFSTVETAWLVAGGLWAAAFLRNPALERAAGQLYDRIDWHYWTGPPAGNGKGLLRHGKQRDGSFLPYSWDRLNGETVFMYVLAAGAVQGRSVASNTWTALEPFYGTVSGLQFNNADLGLFVFQYGLDLLDLEQWQAPGDVDLLAEARVATLANYRVCRETAAFTTYRRYWGLSAGDGPGSYPDTDCYCCYAPSGPIDGTAHITATLASVAHGPGLVMENVQQARHDTQLAARGRYGFSNLNVDRNWVGRDMVGIDAGAAVLALDNYLQHNRVRNIFWELPCVRRGLQSLGFTEVAGRRDSEYLLDQPTEVRRAS
jgi:hypothetical protein